MGHEYSSKQELPRCGPRPKLLPLLSSSSALPRLHWLAKHPKANLAIVIRIWRKQFSDRQAQQLSALWGLAVRCGPFSCPERTRLFHPVAALTYRTYPLRGARSGHSRYDCPGSRSTPGGATLFDALSLGRVFVDRALWSEFVEYERKGDVVGDVNKLISLSLLYDHVADVTARRDR